MKKTISNLLTISIVLFASSVLMSGGCDERPSNVGYHFVEQPYLKFHELLRLLDNKDEARVYNALCNLAEREKALNDFLSEGDSTGPSKRDTLKLIHQKAMTLASSDDPWVSSAAIRLLGELKIDQAAFIDLILRDNRNERNIQLEICKQLGNAEKKDQRSLRAKILFLRSQDDWLLRHSAYEVTDNDDSCASDIFLDDYLHSSDPDARRLALGAMNRHVDRTSFQAVAHAYDTTADEEMRISLLLGLMLCKDPDLLEDWAFALPPRQMDSVISFITEVTLQNDPGQKENPDLSRIILRALRQGWRPSQSQLEPDEPFLPGENYLYKDLLLCKYNTPDQPDSITITKAGRTVENALLADPVLRKEWLDYEARFKPRSLPDPLLKEHHALVETFLKNSRSMILRETQDSNLARFFEKELLQQESVFRKTSVPMRRRDQ